MTKLLEWLSVFIVLLSAYLVVVTRQVQSTFLDEWMFEFTLLPIVAVGLFGIYSVVTILYRVSTFNDCQEAADEIQRQIKEAREDLQKKGLKL